MNRGAQVLALVAVLAAAAAVPALADVTSPPTTTTTTPTTTTPSVPRKTQDSVHVVSSFPAAGEFLVTKVLVRAQPDPRASVVKEMRQFRDDYRVQEVLAVGTAIGRDHKPWYKISVPMRPNGTMGWIPARTVTLSPAVGEIDVHRQSRTIDLYWHGKHVWHGQVAIGRPGMETPLGHYYVAARFVPYQDPFLGVFAVETSGYSRLTEWPGGGWFGIHGTDMPQLLGQAVSHGCVRVSNETATKLRQYAPLGTPIVITDT